MCVSGTMDRREPDSDIELESPPIDGGNDGGKGITDKPGGLKLQCEGHDVRYRNTWIKELDLKVANTDF